MKIRESSGGHKNPNSEIQRNVEMFWFEFIKYLTCVKDVFTSSSCKANTACCILELGLIWDISPVKKVQLSHRKMDDLSAPRTDTWQGGLCMCEEGREG